jgi:hypothetical protein
LHQKIVCVYLNAPDCKTHVAPRKKLSALVPGPETTQESGRSLLNVEDVGPRRI